MMDGCAAGYGTYGMQCDMGPNGDLEGFLDVIAAPFKAAVKVGKFAVTRAPTAAAGFAAGGPAGAAAAVAARELGRRGGTPTTTGRYTTRTGQQVHASTPLQQGSGLYPSQGMYYPPAVTTTQPTGAAPNLQQMATDFFNQLKNRGLETAGRMIAETPQGQAAIREKVTGDISRYLLPAALIGIPLIFVLMRR